MKLQKNRTKPMTDKEIVDGLIARDNDITRYFYAYTNYAKSR